MTLRQRLLLMFSLVVVLAVGAVAWIVSLRTRNAFEQVDQQRTAALISETRGEFARRGEEISQTLDRIAASDHVQRIAVDVTQGGDQAPYIRDAGSLAQEYQLDLLEIVAADGTIISSAQWPARFGYKQRLPSPNGSEAFLQKVDLPNKTILAMMAIRAVHSGEGVIYLIGGDRLDSGFLQAFSMPIGSYVWLYRFTQTALTPNDLLGPPASFDTFRPLLSAVQADSGEHTGFVDLSDRHFDRATIQAFPLKDDAGSVAAALLVGTSRRPFLELQQHIRSTAFGVAGIGILLAIIASLWITARISRPIELLANASQEVASGNWDVRVDSHSQDELGQLAESFNVMTHQLIEQRDRLLQAERVAAWRELARRLAHELKNPLFPLQLTVENLARAREVAPDQFEEIFRESTSTLLAEISNLKTIIGRFSDFSKMPRPQLQHVSLNELVRGVASLHQAQLAQSAHPIYLDLRFDDDLPQIALDPELFHRALSNLVLNAVDAMSNGGTITICTSRFDDCARIEVMDTGTGLTPEERERLFTPYYTTKQHGTGLGLAVVQSVISDHGGSISVESETGRGTTFIIQLPIQSRKTTSMEGTSA